MVLSSLKMETGHRGLKLQQKKQKPYNIGRKSDYAMDNINWR